MTAPSHTYFHVDKAVVDHACSKAHRDNNDHDDEDHLLRDYSYTLFADVILALVVFTFRVQITVVSESFVTLANRIVSALIFTAATGCIAAFTVCFAGNVAFLKVRALRTVTTSREALEVEVTYVIYHLHSVKASVGVTA